MKSAHLMRLTGATIFVVAAVNFIVCFWYTNNSYETMLHLPHNVKHSLSMSHQHGHDVQHSSSLKHDIVPTSINVENHELPTWVTDYFKWHNEMRAKYPGDEIITNESAPKCLVRVCVNSLCGGLHDRLGQLPLDLYVASQTKRMLFIYWLKPHNLEEFLVPPDLNSGFIDKSIKYSVDWRMPKIEKLGFAGKRRRQVGKIHNLPKLDGNVNNIRKKRGEQIPFDVMMDTNLKNLTNGILAEERIATFEILGTIEEQYLEKKLQDSGETDMIHSTPSFGKIFLSFFQPSPDIIKMIDGIDERLGLIPNKYTVVHSRVRHPSGYVHGMKFNGKYASTADRYLPDFVGEFKDEMTKSAIRAIKCAEQLPHNDDSESKVYFMSDMSDLVTYLAFNLTDEKYTSSHPEWFADANSTNATAKTLVSKNHVVARVQPTQNLHIDKAKMTGKENFYATFVDLFIGIRAKCVVFGIGNYARFAAQISHTQCYMKYQSQHWGAEADVGKDHWCSIDPLTTEI